MREEEVASPTVSDRFLNQRKAVLIGVAVVLAYAAPGFVRGVHHPVPVHDVFDSTVGLHGYAGHPASEGFRANDAMLGGLPDAALAAEPKLQWLYFYLMSPYWAYVVGDLVLRLVAFGSMLFLLCSLRTLSSHNTCATAIAFAVLPHYFPACLTVAALPLVLWAVVVCSSPRPNRPAILAAATICAAYPFVSAFHLTGLFLLPGIGLFWMTKVIRTKQPAWPLLAALALMSVSYGLTIYSLLVNQISTQGIVWHRVDRELVRLLSAGTPKDIAVNLFLRSNYQASANPFPLLWVGLVVYLGVLMASSRSELATHWQRVARPEALRVAGLVGFIALVSILNYLYYEDQYVRLSHHVPFLAQLNLTRLYWFFPLCWSLILFYIVASYERTGRLGSLIATILLIGQISTNILSAHWITQDNPSYAEFRSAELFDEAERAIGKDRSGIVIACLGFFPSIAHLNGYRTADGYWYLYPLSYKSAFRKVITKELDKHAKLRDYFDKWGNRCYLMSAELGDDFFLRKPLAKKKVAILDIDVTALRTIGANYVFSAALIENSADLRLDLLASLRASSAAIDLHVYRIPEGD